MAIFLSIGVLVAGVVRTLRIKSPSHGLMFRPIQVLLSLKKTDPETSAEGHTVSASDPNRSMRMNPLQASASMQRSMGRSTSRPDLNSGETRARANSRTTSYQKQERNADDSVDENQVVWEVGSVSDDSDNDEKDGKGKPTRGVGGVRDGYGERGGLLYSDDEEQDEDRAKGKQAETSRDSVDEQIEGYQPVKSPSPQKSTQRSRKDNDEDDPFGDFEEAR